MTATADRPAHRTIRSLEPNTYVEGVYSLMNPQSGSTRAGKPFFKCLIRDASGEMPARMWSFEDGDINAIAATGFVYVTGHTQTYNESVQFIIETIRAWEVSEAELAELLPMTEKDLDEMMSELRGLLGSLSHPAMQALANAYLNDEALMGNFKLAPAATTLHHAWLGGLLEHTLQLMKIADTILPLYPQLNRDIVLMGLFLHDLAKTAELTWEKGFQYTDDGQLIGHIVRGAIWLQFKAAIAAKESGERLPSDALRVLQHIIVSHHGLPEYGAAKVPATPEAIFISQLDDLDARTQLALSNVRDMRDDSAGGDAAWTEKVWALNTRLFGPDPLRD